MVGFCIAQAFFAAASRLHKQIILSYANYNHETEELRELFGLCVSDSIENLSCMSVDARFARDEDAIRTVKRGIDRR